MRINPVNNQAFTGAYLLKFPNVEDSQTFFEAVNEDKSPEGKDVRAFAPVNDKDGRKVLLLTGQDTRDWHYMACKLAPELNYKDRNVWLWGGINLWRAFEEKATPVDLTKTNE